MRILLDTAAFWWIASGSSRLTKRAADAYSDPANDVALSPVSLWELVVKHQIGKLAVARPIAELLVHVRQERLIRSLSVSESAVLRLATLPSLHRDPFDRMLISQALDEDMTLLTPDAQIREYAVPTLW